MEQGAYQGKDDYHVMPLPLRESTPKMPNNRSLALYRLSKLQTRLENDENYRKDYNAFMNDLYAKSPKRATKRERQQLVHSAPRSLKPRKPEKIRVVLD